MLELEYAQASDCGPVRAENQDYVGFEAPPAPEQDQSQGWLFALADGVAGQDKGAVAARTAVETVLSEFRRAASRTPLRSLLPRLLQTANERVIDAGWASKSVRAMATTLVTCGLRDDRAVVSHVGDSRCYAIRDGRATPLTRDHILSGNTKYQGVLTRSLGNDLFVRVDTSEHRLFEGDVLLLCSDGLHRAVSAAQMTDVVIHSRSLQNAANELIGAATARDGSDNVSVQLIQIRHVEQDACRGRLYRTA